MKSNAGAKKKGSASAPFLCGCASLSSPASRRLLSSSLNRATMSSAPVASATDAAASGLAPAGPVGPVGPVAPTGACFTGGAGRAGSGRTAPASPAGPVGPGKPWRSRRTRNASRPHWPHRSPFSSRSARTRRSGRSGTLPSEPGRSAAHRRHQQHALLPAFARTFPVAAAVLSIVHVVLPFLADLPENSGSSVYAEGGSAVRPCAAKYRRLCATAADCERTSAARSFHAQACLGSPNLSQQAHKPSAGS